MSTHKRERWLQEELTKLEQGSLIRDAAPSPEVLKKFEELAKKENLTDGGKRDSEAPKSE